MTKYITMIIYNKNAKSDNLAKQILRILILFHYITLFIIKGYTIYIYNHLYKGHIHFRYI